LRNCAFEFTVSSGFLSGFGLLEVFMNFWLKNGEVSWGNEDFGIFYENGDFGNSPFRLPLSHLLGTYRRSDLVTKSAKLG